MHSAAATREARAHERERRMNAMDEQFLWQMIELAWKKAERRNDGRGVQRGLTLRGAILSRTVGDLDEAMQSFTWALEDILTRHVTKDGVLRFAKAYETQMFALDREDLAQHVVLGDD